MSSDFLAGAVGRQPDQASHLSRTKCHSSSAPSSLPDIRSQIQTAFNKIPNVAHTLHGKRRIHQGGSGRRTALFSSRKNGGAIPVESKLELAHAISLERSSDVISYRTQAIRIPLPEGRSAFPDFVVLSANGQFEVHEVKPAVAHLTNDDIKRFETMETILRSADVGFQLIDASSLPAGRVLEDLLFRYTRGHCKAWTATQIKAGLSLLQENIIVSFSGAYEILTQHGLPCQLADHLSFHALWSTENTDAINLGTKEA